MKAPPTSRATAIFEVHYGIEDYTNLIDYLTIIKQSINLVFLVFNYDYENLIPNQAYRNNGEI